MALEVTKDEADKQQFDATEIHGKDENYVYRWARCGRDGDEVTNIAMHELHGYEIVTRSTEKSALSYNTRMKKGEDVDDTVRWGDMVLMRIPKTQYEERLARERARILRQTKGVAEAYKTSIARIANSEANAFEEHRPNPTMRTVEDADQPMTQQQLDAAMKIASGIEEDVKEE